ncbi:hypothetical protein MAR_011690 [Mya arenaria]|uniref:Uncharacterized protein n=1 Tax=Mya arenaria TaxID=6604 RepID=A0ABY7FZ19_MYAAR|nr:hypothetical protein MAR_011690 [Mya arenaria]
MLVLSNLRTFAMDATSKRRKRLKGACSTFTTCMSPNNSAISFSDSSDSSLDVAVTIVFFDLLFDVIYGLIYDIMFCLATD